MGRLVREPRYVSPAIRVAESGHVVWHLTAEEAEECYRNFIRAGQDYPEVAQIHLTLEGIPEAENRAIIRRAMARAGGKTPIVLASDASLN